MTRCVAIAGARGVIGSAAVETFAAAGYDVLAISRRAPVLAERTCFTHLPLDLSNGRACEAALSSHKAVTHLIYAPRRGAGSRSRLVGSWRIAANAQMFTNVAEPLARAGRLRWAGLLQGTKAYGAHLHPIAHATFGPIQRSFLTTRKPQLWPT